MNKLLVAGLLLFAGIAGYGVARYVYTPEHSAPAAHAILESPDLSGKSREMSHWLGQVVIVNFWATWCPPCREEIPEFIVLQERYREHGLQVIGVALDDPEAVERYSQTMGINYPVLLAQATGMRAMRDYGNSSGGLPFTVILDPEGAIVARKLGIYRYDELEQVIRPLLPVKNAAEQAKSGVIR